MLLVVVAVVVVGVAAGAVVTPFAVAVGPIIVVVLFLIVPRCVGCFCLAFILFVIPLCRKSCPAPCVRNMLICVFTRIFSYFLAVSDYAAAVATPCS